MMPVDLPGAEAYPHGVRSRYVHGCRCTECRRANSDYAKTRARAHIYGGWNGLVDAAKARAHLHRLTKAGVGRRAVHDACGVATSILARIASGEKLKIRALSEKAILGVDEKAIADSALVDAGATWRLLRQLFAAGYKKGDIAQRLGCKTAALQLGEASVLASTALKVKKLHSTLMS